MSVLSKVSRDDLQKRFRGSKVRRRVTGGWSTAKGATRSLTGRAERRWPKRAGIAAAAGVVGGATALLRDPERRRALIGKARTQDVQTPSGAATTESSASDATTASNGRSTTAVGS
jgi:hypothetical protein